MMKMTMHPQAKLLKAISTKRKDMVKIALLKGFISKEAVKQSKELDQLLNAYQKH